METHGSNRWAMMHPPLLAVNSPALQVSSFDANKRYPAGPPYLLTARDAYNIAVHWTKFVLKVHDFFPKMMSAKMHAYSFAAAHLNLAHQLATSFMVSDVSCQDIEGWEFPLGVKERGSLCTGRYPH
jgi:hypothetical protein